MSDIERAEREAFAKYITSQEHIGFDAVVWRGIGGDPLGVLHEPEYSENSLRSEWAAWLARSALAHAARGGHPAPRDGRCVQPRREGGAMSEPERIPEWANIDTVAKWLDVIDNAPERDQWIREALLAAYARGREEAAKTLEDDASTIRLHAGELSAQEMRVAQAVLAWKARQIRAGGV